MPMMNIGTTVKAAASGKLPEVLCSVNTACPMKYCELPSTVGTTKSPSVNANVKIDPATTPGNANGQITCRKVVPGFAPRSPDASSSDFGTRSSAASIEIIMYGSQTYTNAMKMPKFDSASDV